MRHLQATKKFHRPRDQRQALIRSMAHALIMKGRIRSTSARTKFLKKTVERWLTRAKKNDLAGLRYLLDRLPKASAFKLFNEIAPKYKNRAGGYLRVIKLPLPRKHDAAELSLIEFV
ncbi:MAG: 50S ribosomal protein L17 [Patescibacteria group bacterium]|nr:50S ribosomal protein L17 [Patescibacteria group bacterium]MCL5257956.1 50S ribosomal protein L17 [Patescibacteria group bacterium]